MPSADGCMRALPPPGQVLEGITRVLGPGIWANAVLGFTRASESSAPAGVEFAAHVEARAAALRSAVHKVSRAALLLWLWHV